MYKITIYTNNKIMARPAYVYYSEDGTTDWQSDDIGIVQDKIKELSAKYMIAALGVVEQYEIDAEYTIIIN